MQRLGAALDFSDRKLSEELGESRGCWLPAPYEPAAAVDIVIEGSSRRCRRTASATSRSEVERSIPRAIRGRRQMVLLRRRRFVG
jgi:hypothetical protein